MISKITEAILNGSVGFSEDATWDSGDRWRHEDDREWDEPLPNGIRPPPTEAQRKRENNRWLMVREEAGLGHEGRRMERREGGVPDLFATGDRVSAPVSAEPGDAPAPAVDAPPVARVIIP